MAEPNLSLAGPTRWPDTVRRDDSSPHSNSNTRRPILYPWATGSLGSCLQECSSKYAVANVSQPMKKPAPPQIVQPPSPPRVIPISRGTAPTLELFAIRLPGTSRIQTNQHGAAGNAG